MRRRLTSYFMGRSRQPPRYWADIETARALNRVLGTNIGPWEVRGLPDLYLAVLFEGMALRDELAEAKLLK